MNQRVGIAEHELRQRTREIGFADAGWTEKHKRTDRTLGIFQIRARTPQCLANRCDCFVLTDDAFLELGFHPEQFLRLLLFHLLKRDAGDFRNNVHHVIACHDDFPFFAFFPPLVQDGIELFLRLLLLVAKRGGLFKVLCLDRSFFFKADAFDFLLDVFHVGRPRHCVDASARAGLIHDIDGLVREKATGDVTI